MCCCARSFSFQFFCFFCFFLNSNKQSPWMLEWSRLLCVSIVRSSFHPAGSSPPATAAGVARVLVARCPTGRDAAAGGAGDCMHHRHRRSRSPSPLSSHADIRALPATLSGAAIALHRPAAPVGEPQQQWQQVTAAVHQSTPSECATAQHAESSAGAGQGSWSQSHPRCAVTCSNFA